MGDGWRMAAEDAEEYTRALGQVVSGGWRQIALAQKLGVPAALGMTTEEWVREIGGHVRLGLDERREAVKELTNPDADFPLSNRQAAEVLGVDEGTIRKDRKRAENSAPGGDSLEGPPEDRAENSAPEEAASPYDDDDDGLCPRAGAAPTVGDVMSEIADELEASGAFERVEAAQQARRARSVRLTLLEIVSTYPPGVLAEGLDSDELGQLVDDLDRLLSWTETAKQISRQARRPRRVGA